MYACVRFVLLYVCVYACGMLCIILREKCPYSVFFLVPISPHSGWIRRDKKSQRNLMSFYMRSLRQTKDFIADTATQKMKFSIKDFFGRYDQIRSILQFWSHFRKKFLRENFIFCALSHHCLKFVWRCWWHYFEISHCCFTLYLARQKAVEFIYYSIMKLLSFESFDNLLFYKYCISKKCFICFMKLKLLVLI